MGARDRLRKFFEDNVGKTLDMRQLSKVADIHEWARRIRELRLEEGMQILTHNDREDLKPGQYILITLKRLPKMASGIPADQRARILERNGMTCQICGVGPNEPNPYNPEKRVRLQVDHIIPLSEGGTNDDSNLRVTCSVCNLGRSNLFTPPDKRSINLLGHIRRAPKSVQLEVYEFLKRKFESPPSSR